MYKRTLSVTLISGLVFASACSSGGSNPSNNMSTKESGTAQPAQSGQVKQEVKPEPKKGKFIFWDKSEYVKDYNDFQKERVAQFSKEFNVEVEYVAIPPADVKTKLLAAVEAGNPPDLLLADDFVAKQFVSNNQLVDISDILKQFDFREDSKKYAFAMEGLYEVPVYHSPNVMYVRKDKLEEKK
jgi:multiple sugar transport system substrate-binding protein